MTPAAVAPLAQRMRPRTLDELVGQEHLLAPGAPLRVLLEAGKIPSMVFWGPPGVGKTTLARIIANHVDAEFLTLSAVMAGVKDIRESVAAAKDLLATQRRTILFIDKIHRF
ncbi:MAG TPA: AAA family ATPase, partial [Nevskiaceae bacterium]|nr:AAA family ATPase [Nevskiaceae bacterium]